MSDLVILLSIAAVVALFIAAGRLRSSALEQSLLLASALAQFALLIAGWGHFGNVHGDFILLVFILLIGLAVFLGELFLALGAPSRWRFLRLAGVVAFSVLLVAVGDRYGR